MITSTTLHHTEIHWSLTGGLPNWQATEVIHIGLILWEKFGLLISKVAVVSTLPDMGNVGLG